MKGEKILDMRHFQTAPNFSLKLQKKVQKKSSHVYQIISFFINPEELQINNM